LRTRKVVQLADMQHATIEGCELARGGHKVAQGPAEQSVLFFSISTFERLRDHLHHLHMQQHVLIRRQHYPDLRYPKHATCSRGTDLCLCAIAAMLLVSFSRPLSGIIFMIYHTTEIQRTRHRHTEPRAQPATHPAVPKPRSRPPRANEKVPPPPAGGSTPPPGRTKDCGKRQPAPGQPVSARQLGGFLS